VLVAAGFGMSATSFLLDTVETNLTEHLVERGYDVWLFDYRASIDLPSSHSAFTLDDIATRDWPEAVAEVRRVTGAGSVQALGHCVGSVSLMMALAAGLTDVRSAVCMQFTLHPATSYLNQFKAFAQVDKVMGRIGLSKVEPLSGLTVPNAALDMMLRGLPMPRAERCGKALCRWVNAIYGCTHAHDQLDDATHDQLGDMFGVGNLAALGHMGTIMQRRLAVDRHGQPAYTQHPERLQLPILLVQGEKNYIFRPAGSMRTLRWLQTANEPSLYERVVLPGYAHLDALVGRSAATDVYPLLSDHLDRFNW
jgi:cholesterol oxidase